MPTYAEATVIDVLDQNPQAARLVVRVDGCSEGDVAVAVAYPSLVGDCAEADKVLLNTTAVDLGLGTGGEHIVVANLTRPLASDLSGGHIMKMRYAPHQIDVLAAEEEGSDLADSLAEAAWLEGFPVVILSLHSQLAAACAVARRDAPRTPIAFAMSDATALPAGVSRLLARLRSSGLLDYVVTCGQAFGGEIEAVNRYTGLLAARAAGAGVIIAGAGPGSVGTGTLFGHSGVDVGEWVNAVAALGGTPVVAPRLSVADERARHRGLSHHTRTALGAVARSEAIVALPEMEPALAGTVDAVLGDDAALARHEWRRAGDVDALGAMAAAGLEVKTMGRAAATEPALFDAAGAATRIALELSRKAR